MRPLPWRILSPLLNILLVSERVPSRRSPISQGVAEARTRLVRIVREEPGILIRQLHARMAMGWGALYRHLGALEEQGELVVKREGKFALVYHKEDVPKSEADLRIRVLDPLTLAVAQFINEHPGCNARVVVEEFVSKEFHERTVYKSLERLHDEGFVESDSETRRYDGMFATRTLRDGLARL